MEHEFLRWLQPQLAPHPQVLVGVGDDAAVLASRPGRSWVVTTDTLTEGVDFRVAVDDAERIGRKALAVNLSDVAAMAAEPVAAFVSLVLPREGAGELARRLLHGMLPLAREFGVSIAGGDTNTWGEGLVVSVTLLGQTSERGALLRSGGRPGDDVLATGRFGGSFLGRQFDFTPRVREALVLHSRYRVTAGIDVSDGVSLDVSRLAAASGCGVELDLRELPIAPAAYRLSEQPGDGKSPLEHALSDGEDFELLLAATPDETRRMLSDQPLDVPLRRIGRLIAEPGLWGRTDDGSRISLRPAGWEHREQGEERP